MFRLVYRLLVFLFLFAVIRYVLTTVTRIYAELKRSHNPQSSGPQVPKTEVVGELKQDPVCGTFIPTASSVKKTVNGELIHFCSAACRDKFKMA